MTIIKRPLDPRRLRLALPRGFGWIDHRFLTDGYLRRSSPEALGLYCLVVCASDSQGLSYYSDQRLRELLTMDPPTLFRARRELIDSGLIAYQKPLYQVLALEDQPHSTRPNCRTQRPCSTLSPSLPESPQVPLPPGLNLRAMIEASLREGGVV